MFTSRARAATLVALGASLALLSACGGDSNTSDPMERIQSEIIGPMGWDEKVMRLYGMDQPLQPGQTVGPAVAMDGSEGQVQTIDKPTWFFWADTSLNPLFAHLTHFITMDEDGSNLQMVDQDWFPVIDGKVFHPDKPLWGAPRAGQVTQAITDELTPYCADTGPCGLTNHAVVLVGLDSPELEKSVNRLLTTLEKRKYKVSPFRLKKPATGEDPDAGFTLIQAFLDQLEELSKQSKEKPLGQLDIFYLGHGTWYNTMDDKTNRGLWVIGQNKNSAAQLKMKEILERLNEIEAQKINFVVESCHSGYFKIGLKEQMSQAKLEAIPIRVLSSCNEEQESSCTTTDGCFFMEKLLDQLDQKDDGQAFNLDPVTIKDFDTVIKKGKMLHQNPGSYLEPPTTPVLYLEDPGADCQVVGTLKLDETYRREVQLRGAGFGPEQGKGKVTLYRWDWAGELVGEYFKLFRFPPGDGVELSVTYWSDDAITVEVPMRSLGFPSDPTAIDEMLFDGKMWANPLHGSYHMGRYFVQITTNEGKKTKDFKTLTYEEALRPGTLEEWFKPQLIHINPGIRSAVWLPDYTNREEYEWHEFWHPITPASPAVGQPTVLISDLRLIDPGEDKIVFPYLYQTNDMTLFDEITLRRYDLGNVDHTTGSKALNYGGWSYYPAAGVNPPSASACVPEEDGCTLPDDKFTYWSLGMDFEPGWNGTATWSSILIYD